ncbi:MAG: hypothetical protein IPJ33_06915 [Gammaproteobacteria bacterium]|nr:hypothetical protein [Gammaproteobacteria bacterium]
MPIGHQFSFGYFKLSADEALLVEFRPKEVPFWSIQLTNCWFEALTFDDNRSRINNQSARCDPNGLVRVIIIDGAGSKQNAVDTLGHREGTMVFRWSRTAEPVPAIKTEVIKRTSSLDARADPAPVGRLAAKLSE